jgi:CDGSH-type Zn-finger protein
MKITALPDASLMIETVEELTDGSGRAVKVPIYLCRCGASRNKPYCDGAHAATGFKAPQAVITGLRRVRDSERG